MANVPSTVSKSTSIGAALAAVGAPVAGTGKLTDAQKAENAKKRAEEALGKLPADLQAHIRAIGTAARQIIAAATPFRAIIAEHVAAIWPAGCGNKKADYTAWREYGRLIEVLYGKEARRAYNTAVANGRDDGKLPQLSARSGNSRGTSAAKLFTGIVNRFALDVEALGKMKKAKDVNAKDLAEFNAAFTQWKKAMEVFRKRLDGVKAA